MIRRCFLRVTSLQTIASLLGMSLETPSRRSRLRRADFAAAVIGCVLVVAALSIIWGARLTVPRELYVSELGAEGEPTAKWFQAALLFIVIGGSAIAWAGRNVRSSVRVLAAWTPAVSLWIACGLFLVASQVTCTSGCPLPYGDSFTWQDFSHTSSAVLAFAAACWAMLQTSFADGHRVLALLSRASGVLVGVIAGTGGLLSLFRFQVVLGSRLEFIATTLAIGWLVVFGAVLALRSARVLAPRIDEQPLAPQEAKQPIG
jgi:tetrahydromethanopterin S-methyltransferase subunit D